MNKTEQYESLLPQVKAVMDSSVDVIANMANMAAMLHETFGFWWTGFYRVIGNELVLGPFQGKVACIRIEVGKGVCGTTVAEDKTQLVKNVHEFPGHIACDSASNSEIVVPIHRGNEVVAVLDIDSPSLSRFDEADREGLELFVKALEETADFFRISMI